MTEQEKPVAIFLPQHRPGRVSGPSKPVVAAVMATVVILGGSLFFMMPRGDIASPTVVAEAEAAAPVRSVSVETNGDASTVASIAADEPAPSAETAPQAAEPAPATLAAAAPSLKAARAADVPRKDDPRWARAETRSGSKALEAVRKLIVEKAAQVDEGGSDLLAYAGTDRGGSGFSDSASAERRPMQIVLPAELPDQPDASTRTASVNAPVNMRKGPGAKHGVVMVIPRRATVEIYDCDQWCKVGYEGRTGYIYKSFVRGRTS